MKMEIKHLAPYLPYELKYKIIGEDDRTYVIDGIYSFNDVYSDNNGECAIIMIKPILRPLSDLTKEIEHNGEKFVPYEHSVFVEMMKVNEHLEYLCEAKSDLSEDGLLPYSIVQLLFEWHFDVFNLHENGLCISYNELKK